jgi:hypothetical protein|nr:hypothetical protein [Serratia fonticola]
MDSKLQPLAGEVQLPGQSILPPTWRLNERQKRFIEALLLPEEDISATTGVADNLVTPSQNGKQHLQQSQPE